MNTELAESAPPVVSTSNNLDSSKLLSLLALAAGAMAIPQGAEADIIFQDLSTAPPTVSPGGTSLFVLDQLPGAARLGFIGKTKSTTRQWVTAGQQAGYVRLKTNASFVVPVDAGKNWNQVVGNVAASGTVGRSTIIGHNPAAGFDHKYLLFAFQDSTQGNKLLYGWVQLSLVFPVAGTGPEVTIFGYAYDDTGALILTGQVPEPGVTGLVALGALVLGARGVRGWRRNRPASNS